MGLLNAGGVSNDFTSWWDQHRNAISQLGVGLASGNTPQQGIALATQGLATGRVADDAYATTKKAEAERQAEINATQKALAKFPDLAALAVPGADMGPILSEYFKRMSPDYGARADAGFSLNPGEIRFDAAGHQIAAAPAANKPQPAPTLTSIYDNNGREQKGYMQDGKFVPVGSPKATTERPEFNANQANAAGFADRMTQSDAIISNPKITKVLTDVGEHRGDLPLIGNFIASPEYQQADQAKRDFINATLRRESGAVISEGEFANANRQYFPQPGDSPAVLAQKAANRKNVTHAIARAAGTAYQTPDTTNYLDDPNAAGGTDLSGMSDEDLLNQLNN